MMKNEKQYFIGVDGEESKTGLVMGAVKLATKEI
jgi:hypothetical protein